MTDEQEQMIKEQFRELKKEILYIWCITTITMGLALGEFIGRVLTELF